MHRSRYPRGRAERERIASAAGTSSARAITFVTVTYTMDVALVIDRDFMLRPEFEGVCGDGDEPQIGSNLGQTK